MEHSLHIAVKHFIEKINSNLDCADTGDLGVDGDDEVDTNELQRTDSLGKAIALVKQVC